MSRVTFYGASDDLVEVDGDLPGCDEYNSEDESFVISGGGKASRVRVRYGDDGCWGITVSPYAEGTEMLAVIVGAAPDNDYSAYAITDGVEQLVREKR